MVNTMTEPTALPAGNPSDYQQYKESIEREVLATIARHLKKGDLSLDQAKQVAKALLETLSQTQSLTQLHEQLPELEEDLGVVGEAIEPLLNQFSHRLVTVLNQTIAELAAANKIRKLHQLVTVAVESESIDG